MKKIRFTAWILAACLLLAGCAAPHTDGSLNVEDGSIPMPEITPAPTAAPVPEEPVTDMETVGAVAYDALRVPSAFAQSEDFSAELYALLMTAVRNGEEKADFSALSVNETQFNAVRKYIVIRDMYGVLGDITKGEGMTAVITYPSDEEPKEEDDGKKKPKETPAPTPTPEPEVDPVKRFDDAVQLMIETTVTSETTQLSAAIALYKHIAQSVMTDNEAEEIGMYGAAVQGKGTVLSVANLYSYVLDQIGIENVVVTSEDGSHAWNVVTIGDNSFHCDVQMEAGLNDGQALTGFGLSDADVARINGWNTWISENAALLTCSKTLMADVNAAIHADIDAVGNAVYFDGMYGMDGVWRMDLATGNAMQLTQEPVTALAVLGEHVYFINENDSMLYCLRIADGEVHQAIEGVAMEDIRRVGTEIRYATVDDPTTEHAISIE